MKADAARPTPGNLVKQRKCDALDFGRRLPASRPGLSPIQMRARRREYGAKHIRREDARVRVVTRAMVAVEKMDLPARQGMDRAMREGKAGKRRAEGPQRALMRDPPEDDDRAQVLELANRADEIPPASRDFLRRRFVLRRRATHRVD